MIEAIQTEYNGYRFRSRTEARWAVFFDAAGFRYEYEKEGFKLSDGTYYLPDFWLPDFGMWFEVKGGPATDDDLRKAELMLESGHAVIVAEGPPSSEPNLIVFASENMLGDGKREHGRFRFANDRKNEGEFWLLGEAGARSIGPVDGPDHGKYPAIIGLQDAYDAAREARFEHGEKPKRR
jgi:hypothetical protein